MTTDDGSSLIKDRAFHLVQQLPANATWDDLMYRIYVRQAIEAGLADSDADRVTDVDDVLREFGIEP